MTAATTLLQQQTIGDTITSWSQTLQFGQFDPSLGTLTGVAFGLTGDINGSIILENLDRAPATFGAGYSGRLDLVSPDGYQVASAAPSARASTTLAAGAMTTLSGIAGSASDQQRYVPGASPSGIAAAAFLGAGMVPLTVNARQSTLHVAGPGNMALVSQAAAGASVSLQYGYAPPESSGGGGTSGSVTVVGSTSRFGATYFNNPLPLVTTTPQTFSFADRTTGWNDSAAVRGFDPALGTLQSVNITVTTDLLGSMAAENLDSSAASVSTTDVATLTLDLPGSTPTFAYGPSIVDTMSLGAFDGSTDYAGISGHADLLSVQPGYSSSTTLNSPADLAAFTGQGMLVLPVSATSSATIDGPGNLAAGLLTEVGGTVSVSYTYSATSPGAAAASIGDAAGGYTATDLTTGQPDTAATVQPYAGGPTQELTDHSGDSLAINLTSDNWLIGTDGGNDVITAHGGNNVFAIGGGSNWLFGAGGDDTFSLRAGAASTWDTIVNFHAGDWLAVWGISPQNAVAWLNGAGAPGYSGLSLEATATDGTVTGVTLARYYSTADFTNGRLATGFGADPATGTSYLYVHANS